MSKAKTFHFNNLPATVRQRFVACTRGQEQPVPLLTMPKGMGWPVGGGIALVLFALLALKVLWGWGYGSVWEEGAIFGAGGLIGFAILLGTATIAIGFAVKRAMTRGRLPYEPGVYLLGNDLIDATGSTLRVEPVLSTRPDIVHHHYNGGYTGTSVTFHGAGHTYKFMIRNRNLADNKLASLRNGLVRLQAAIEAQDLDTIRSLDPFFDVKIKGDWDRLTVTAPTAPPTDGPAARSVPALGQHAMIIGAVIALAAAPLMWTVRNRASDEAMLASATTAMELEFYLDRGGRHNEVARKRLHEVALQEAIDKPNPVTALREYLTQYPEADAALRDKATARIHELFTTALAEFKAQAGRDPRATEFIERLLTYQEQAGSPPLEVRFRPPKVSSLADIDTMLAGVAAESKGKFDFAPLAPNFDQSTAETREATITSSLTGGFSGVFPNEMLELKPGARLAPGEEIGKDVAAIEVSYEVLPMPEDDGSPAIYVRDSSPYPGAPPVHSDEPTGRLYVGVEVHFDVTMRVPGAAPYDLTLKVRPPERFDVGGSTGDADIYRIMADRAFDNLRTNLTAAFFHTDEPLPEEPVEEPEPPKGKPDKSKKKRSR